MSKHAGAGMGLWTVGAVVLAGGLLVCSCGGGPKGRRAYESEACPQCHGLDMKGTERGPSLLEVPSVWQSQELRAYIADPPAYVEHSERLQALKARYAVPMPRLRIDARHLDEIVQFLMTQQESSQ